MKPNISIVLANHNRRRQLENTLDSIAWQKTDDIEVIIVDDTDVEAEDIFELIRKYDFRIKLVPLSTKEWVNPLVSYNIGFNIAKGDIIIFQNPECLHVGNVLQTVRDGVKNGVHLAFAAYSVDYHLTDLVFPQCLPTLIDHTVSPQPQYLDVHHGWYNHSFFNPTAFHFCAAMTRHDMERINGFDERYKDGVAHDDCEILVRIKNAGIKTVIVDSPFVIHQKHKRTGAKRTDPLWQKNYSLYEQTLKENIIKAPNNKYYVR